MHHLLLITLAVTTGATSLEARMSARSKLIDDDSFCGEGGRFGAPLCDWFVIGGRWSGFLHRQLLGQPYEDAFRNEFPELAREWIAEQLIVKHRSALNQLWRRFGGRDGHPLTRTGYEELGYDDDAMLIDQALYDRLLKPYAGQDFGGDNEFADFDSEPVEESFIDRKWLVAVDYHN
ncbi:MAG TPA: hypothetical protein VMG10_35400 [Gemmataceae bacterium]|nr:hypothetical protein [Gemmataceae bacterium]